MRDELIVKTSKQVTGSFDYRTLGGISFIESRARINIPFLRGVFATELKHVHLDSSNPKLCCPQTMK